MEAHREPYVEDVSLIWGHSPITCKLGGVCIRKYIPSNYGWPYSEYRAVTLAIIEAPTASLQTISRHLPRRLHVALWYIHRPRSNDMITPSRTMYIPYNYMEALGSWALRLVHAAAWTSSA